MRKRKEQDEFRSYNGGGIGYSQDALDALMRGNYREFSGNRQAQYRTSQEQTEQAKSLPKLNGISIPSLDAWESNFSKNKSNIDTDRARAKYEQKIGHTPIGKALTEKDAAILYNGALRMLNNNMSAREAAEDMRAGRTNGTGGMMQGYIKNKNWEQEYGKSLEDLIDEYSKNEGAIQRHTDEVARSSGDVSKTLGSVYMNAFVKPVMGAKTAVKNLINPESKSAENTNKLARMYSDLSNTAREDVTKDMSGVGKTFYDVGTSVADRVLPFLLPGGKAIGSAGTLFRTAEDKRESLEDRGITGRGAIGQSLASGGIDAALDIVGLEKVKGLKALRESGNLGKALLGSAAIGGGEQAITSAVNQAIDRVANGKDSVYSTNVANYKAQGMSDEDAQTQALIDEAKTLGQEAVSGAAFGAVMGAGGKLAGKAANKLTDTADIDTVVDNAVKQADEATANIKKAAEQLPEQPNKVVNESRAQNPRLVKALEGDDIKRAKADRADLNKRINSTKNTIELQEQNVKNAKNKADRAYETQKLNEMKAQLADLQAQRKGIDRQIKGEPTPVIEQLTPEEVQSINDFKAEVRKVGNMWAGDEGKELAKRVNAALDKYIETGSDEDLREYAMELWHLHESATGEYTSKAGNTSRYSDYNDDEYNLFTKGTSGLDPVFSRSRDINGVVEGQPKNNISAENGNIIPENGGNGAGNGNIPPENGNVPPQTDISRRYETLKKSDLFTKSEANMKMLESAKEKGVFNKDVEARKVAQNEALQEYLNDKDAVIAKNLDKAWDSGKDVDTSMLILQDALDSGDNALTNLTLSKQVTKGKEAGRQLRAMRDYAYAGTKEGTITKAAEFLNDKADEVLSSRKTAEQFNAIAERILNGDLSDLDKRFNMDDINIQNIKDALDAGAGKADIAKMIAMYQSVGKTGISPEAIQQINDIYNQIEQGNFNPNSKARADLEADAFKVLANDIGGKRSWKEMWDSWRYLAMLGNPKTHLRNVLGNATHYMVTEAKDNIGAVIESAVDKVSKNGIDRTKAVLSPSDRGLVDIAAKDADDVAYASLSDAKNKYDVKDEIGRARDSFNNKLLSKIDDLNSNALDIEDYSALKRKYSKSLTRFLKANGADESIFNATDDASKALLDKGRAYAIDQAKQATFHEYSKMAQTLNQLSKNLSEGNAASKAGGMILEGLLPFKKTPINILKQGIKYSPVSIAKSVATMTDAVRTGNKSAADAIEDLASGLTGTGIMAMGAFLANQGLLTGGANENYDVDTAETEQGAQNYALKIGNNSYTLDWLAPMSLPLFVGAELMNKYSGDSDDEEGVFDRVISALSTIGEPITEMSMLQGIQNILNELSYSTENVLATFGTNATLGYASQAIPTLAGQFARAIDDTRRSTYTDKPAGFKRQFDKTLTKVENKIPFLSMTNEPYVNASGNTQQNDGLITSKFGNGFLQRLGDQMLSPGYYKQGNVTPVDEELNRLYEATGENIYKNVSSGKVNNEKLSKEKFTDYQKLYGSNTDTFYNGLVSSENYKNLDDAARVKALSDAKSISKMIADYEVGGRALKDSEQKVYDIYKKQGADGIVQYINDKQAAKSLGMEYDTYVNKESEQPGGAQAFVENKQSAIDAGFVKKDGTANIEAYDKAVSIVGNDVPKLNAYKQIKDYTNNADLLPALMNSNAFSDDEKGQIVMAQHGYKYDDLGATAKGTYDREGAAGVYYFYLLKNLADTDGNGSVKKAEKEALLNSDNPYVTQLSDDMYYYLAGAKW